MAFQQRLPLLVFAALFVLFAFGALDVYYLAQERPFREFYRDVQKRPVGDAGQLALEPPKLTAGQYLSGIRSISTGGFYLLLLMGTAVLLSIGYGGQNGVGKTGGAAVRSDVSATESKPVRKPERLGVSAERPFQNAAAVVAEGRDVRQPVPAANSNRSVSTPTVAAAPKPKQRSTFYSFHYDDVFRVNHVRNAGAILPIDKQRLLTPQDKSLWEEAKNTNPGALKMMIARGLAGTTVTAVLAGEYTWERPWVRYEIARSLLKGNGLLTVHIDGCECPRNGFGRRGPNPLDYIALGLNRQIYDLNANGIWMPYDKLTTRLTDWPKWLRRPAPRHVMPLSWSAPSYEWISDNSRENLVRWTHEAAKAAGR